MLKARWVFTDAELARKGKDCKADDEFIATFMAGVDDEVTDERGVLVQRNGEVTNRFADGTAGVPEALKELIGDVETYYSSEEDTYADNWRNVVLNDDGTLHHIEPLKGDTVTEQINKMPFRGKWSFDGCGLNRNGQRILTMVDSVRNTPEGQTIGRGLQEFAQEAKRLSVRHFGEQHLPQVFLTANLPEIKSTGDTVCTVEVKRGDKTARFNLRLLEHNGRVSAELVAMKRDTDVSRSVQGTFVDWETPNES